MTPPDSIVKHAAVDGFFSSKERAAWGGFIATQSRLFARIDDDLRRRFGITHAEFEVLLRLSLAPTGRVRMAELAERSLLTRSGISRVVERLARAGYVTREGAAEDGRGAYAVLADKGRAHFHAAATAHVTLVREAFLSRFSAAELETMAGYWQRLRRDDD